MTDQQQKINSGFRILNWIGIIEQLVRNLATRRLHDLPLTFPQMLVLNHFSHRPDEHKTVTSIASAMQQSQPAITKTVKALLAAGYLEAHTDPLDKRVKWLRISGPGLKVRQQAISAFGPDIGAMFAAWNAEEMAQLMSALDRLKLHLDENRSQPVEARSSGVQR